MSELEYLSTNLLSVYEHLKEWDFIELGVVLDSNGVAPSQYPPNEERSQIVYVSQHNIGVYLSSMPMAYKLCLKYMNTYPEQCSALSLMINADCTKAWTTRFGLDLPVEQELRFTELLMTKHKKGFLIYHYRERLISSLAARGQVDDERWLHECMITARVISRYSRAYHLYKHLQWIVSESDSSQVIDHLMRWTETTCLMDPTDYTVLSLRRVLIEKRLPLEVQSGEYHLSSNEIRDCDMELLRTEYIWSATLVHCIPGNSSLWLYHYTVFHILLVLVRNSERKQVLDSAKPFSFESYFKWLYEQNGIIKASRQYTIDNIRHYVLNTNDPKALLRSEEELIKMEKKRHNDQRPTRYVEHLFTRDAQ